LIRLGSSPLGRPLIKRTFALLDTIGGDGDDNDLRLG
jgi:hypothetical protein